MTNDKFFLTLLLISSICLVFVVPVSAQSPSPTDQMLAANRLYEARQFAEAAQTYQQLVDSGLHNSVLFYNLGNAHFKQSDLGRAILNYRRAEQLAPRDPDIIANIAIARSQTVDQLQAQPPSLFSKLTVFAQTWLTLNQMAGLALGLWLVLAVLLLLFIWLKPGLPRRIIGYSLFVVSVLLMLGMLSWGSRMYVEQTRPAAIIVADQVNVTSGPGDQYITEFTLHSGAEVSVVEERSQWMRITLSGDQLQGWVPAQTVETVRIP